MKKHTKIYMQFFGYGIDDFIPCEACGAKAIDIHHVIYRSHGGTDEIYNLIALCRDCHNKAHDGSMDRHSLNYIHHKFINANITQESKA